MILKPITTEKAVKLIELENTLVFSVERKFRKKDIRKEIEDTFNVKVDKINLLLKENKKKVYVKLNKKNPAIDIATKLGMI
ncbi:MAG: 50S ribosomal protein L23 [archaeon]